MRNCFVLGCDASCKKNNKVQRKMFLPPKNEVFKSWEKVLNSCNKKRPFKQNDRVCELHFNETDIINSWESIINGVIIKTPRDKPKLRENAVPCRNLPIDEGNSMKADKSNSLKERIVQGKNKTVSDKNLPTSKRKAASNEIESVPSKKEKIVAVIETPAIGESTDMQKVIETAEIEFEIATAENLELFENLFDEAFDVTLPSLLWGIHRDPERKFIVFSEFSNKTMSHSRIVHITNTLRCTTFLNNNLKSSKILQIEKQVTDCVSEILEELDKEEVSSL